MSLAIRSRSSFLAAIALLTIFSLSPAAWASGVVSNATESSLVAAMAGGGSVTFAINGTIYLSNTIVISDNTVLDATGHNVAISGSNAVQIFVINSRTTVSMTNLSLINGYVRGAFFTDGTGGAISNSGTLQITACSFISNNVVGISEPTAYASGGAGGAIFNSGIVAAQSCLFFGNSATGGGGGLGTTFQEIAAPGGAAAGGAFLNAGQATFINCVFSNNAAVGGVGGTPYPNGDPGYGGQTGGEAWGGAIFSEGTLMASNSAFVGNVAAGGNGGFGTAAAAQGADYAYSGGAGGSGGNGNGGAICVGGGFSVVVNDTFWGNSATGGTAGPGGAGEAADVPRGPGGNGGNGGAGGTGSGGGLGIQSGAILAWNITLASNSVAAGAGGAGGAGGTGLEATTGAPGAAGSAGTAGGDCIGNLGGTMTLKNSILSPNAAADTNIFGPVVDAGYNLSSDQQDTLTNATSLNGVDPVLAPFGNYGGPTPTMALLPGSPAIDGADPADFPATDQRGVPRPFGPAPDIGAFREHLFRHRFRPDHRLVVE